ncbi:efflux RND transporter periplasmic adaptor subunit [Planctomycetota bacterium]|nr:efflux RND transporter periplasmic adaptor subunit [Planctomycetota bacterium]
MGHSTAKVFWISMIAAGVGMVLGALGTSGVFILKIQKQAMEQVAIAMEEMKAGSQQGPPPASVRTGVAQVMDVQDRFDVVGRLQELQMSEIASEVEGKVLRVPVEEGDRVTGGKTVIAEIDSTWVKLNLKQAEADLASREAKLLKSESDLVQLERLAKVNSAKPKEVTDMRAQVQSERADLESSRAAVERAKEQLGRLTIIAPFDGLVVKQMTEEGQWVSPGGSIAEIISDGKVDAKVNVPERYINQISVGDQVNVVIDALGTITKGEVLSVTPMGSNTSRTFPVKVRLDDMEGKLLPGMSVTARLPIGEKNSQVVVPRDAVMYTMQGPVVWIAAPNPAGEGMPIGLPVYVRELFGVNGQVVIQTAKPDAAGMLNDGTQVIVMGAESILFAGQPLVIDNKAVAEESHDASNSADDAEKEVTTEAASNIDVQVAG